MGTNYYLRRIPTKEDYDKIVYYAVKRDIYDDYNKENLFSIIHDLNRRIHLCKISCGWYPLFEHHNGLLFDLNRQSLIDYTKQFQIVDEYGEIIPFEKFWNEIYRWYNIVGLKDSQKSPKSQYTYCDLLTKNTGINPEHDDFYIDGIRFSTFSDFS